MSECAACGQPLIDELDECLRCNNEPARETFLTPKRQKRNIASLRLAVIGALIGGAVIVTIARRISDFKDALGPAILYVVAGLAGVLLLVRLFAASTTRRP